MANNQKTVQSLEATNDTLVTIVAKAMGYPKKGTHVGAGPHAIIQNTWDGQGQRPYGWTGKAVDNWVVNASESHVPISDALATALLLPSSLALLSAAEQATLTNALATRSVVDLEAKVAIPKADAVAVGATAMVEKP